MKRVVQRGVLVSLLVGLATGLTEASFALGAELTFEWYVAAVACVAWVCGRRSGLVAAVLSSVAVDFLFLPFHRFSFGMGVTDATRLVIFVGLAALVAHLVDARNVAEEERVRRERLLATVAHELGDMMLALRHAGVSLQSGGRSHEQIDRAACALVRTADDLVELADEVMDWRARRDDASALGDDDVVRVLHHRVAVGDDEDRPARSPSRRRRRAPTRPPCAR
jgi:K+-sensing histidine kinase KdpD